MSKRGGRGLGCAIGTIVSVCLAALIGVIVAGSLFVAIIAGAGEAAVTSIPVVGPIVGWLFGGGSPSGQPANRAPDALMLWTPTPRPPLCSITPTPVIITATPDINRPTPVPPDTAEPPISIALPTATPCPKPPNPFNTPDPRWTPVPAGYGPHGSPFHGHYYVTQEYGCTSFPETRNESCRQSSGGSQPWMHYGIDMAVGYAPIYATIAGTVVYARGDLKDCGGNFAGCYTGDPPYHGFGNIIVVAAGDFRVYYPHLSQVFVHTGDTVDWGQVLGREGSTGYSTGSHLHYQIMRNYEPVDPVPFLYR